MSMAFKFSAEEDMPIQPFVFATNEYTITLASEPIPGAVNWRRESPETSLVLHLGGNISSIETSFAGRSMRLEPPMRGEIWLIPANAAYDTTAHGDSAIYAEIVLSDAFLGGRRETKAFTPVAGHFDREIFYGFERLIMASNNSDDISSLNRFESIDRILDRAESIFSTTDLPRSWRDVRFSPQVAKKIEDLIYDRISEPLEIRHLCSVAGESPHRFLWGFRNYFRSTPAQYVLDLRIRMARHLLKKTNRSVTDIAMETGFSNPSHLSTAFAHRVGLTPSQYRSSI